jgi:hypothetical protein
MQHPLTPSTPRTSSAQLLLAYVADLELEVDRLRKHVHLVRHEVGDTCGKQLKVKDELLAKKVKPTLEVLEDRTMPSSFNPGARPRGWGCAAPPACAARRPPPYPCGAPPRLPQQCGAGVFYFFTFFTFHNALVWYNSS